MKTLIKSVRPLLLLASLSATAQITVYNLPDPETIPDNDASGVALSFSVTGLPMQITDVSVTLDISGGFNGDLYAYLSSPGGCAILLNRVGRTEANDLGSSDPGMALTLSGSAAADIHFYQASSPAAGAWAADGRDLDPASSAAAFDTTPRAAKLSSLNGLDPNGRWTLFLADVSPGGVSTLNSLSVSITAVPEPAHAAVAVSGVLAGLALFRQLYRGPAGRCSSKKP